MIVFFFLFLTIFSLEKSEGASFLKEGVREGIYFAKGFKSTYRAFSQARDLSNFLTSVELTSKRFGTTLRPIPHGYYGSEERSLPFALLTLGACGVSLFVNQNIKSEGRDTEFETMVMEGYEKLKDLEERTKGKELVFLIGPTGGGKTFMAKRLTGQTVVDIKEKESHNKRYQFQSQTLYPDDFCKGDLCFCDVPGSKEIGTDENRRLLAPMILKCALVGKKARLGLVIDPNCLETNKGAGLKRTFDEEFFPLLRESVFDEKGVLCVFNDKKGRKEERDYSTTFIGLQEQAQKNLVSACNTPLAPLNPKVIRKLREEHEFYVKGLERISVSFIDFNIAEIDEIFERLQRLEPFQFSLKPFDGDIEKLLSIYGHAQALRNSRDRNERQIRLIEMENEELGRVIASGNRQNAKERMTKERESLELSHRESSERHKSLIESDGGIRTYLISEKRTRFPVFGRWTRTNKTVTNVDKKPFRWPVYVWVNGKLYDVFPHTKPERLPNTLRGMKIKPEEGEFELHYKGDRGEDDNVSVLIEMADSESGVLSIRAKELKEVGKNIAHTDKLIKESEEFLFLLNKGGKGDLEVRRKSNTEKLRVLIEKRDRKDKQLEEGSRLFEATSGLVSRLYDGSEAEDLFRKKTVSNKGK